MQDMEFKLNEQGIETYVSSLTNKLLAEFFSESDYVLGKDIPTFTIYEQINFFVLKNLFTDWQAEMTRLKSPYFDYENQDVQNALSALMNKLSHHIRINRDDFEGLLYNSIYDTIELVCTPKEFIVNNILEFPSEVISIDELKVVSKYIKTNSHYFSELIENFEDAEELVVKELKLHIQTIHEQVRQDNLSIDSFIGRMSELLPVSKSDFLIMEATEQQTDEPAKVEILEKEPAEVIEPKKEIAPEPSPQPIAQETPESLPEEKTDIKEIIIDPEKLEKKSLNDQFLKEEIPETLNEKLASEEGKNLATELRKKSVRSIKDSIGLNQKFMFQKALFNGQNDDYEFAINRLDDFDNYDDISNFLIDNYAQKYEWSKREKEVSELFQLIAKKF